MRRTPLSPLLRSCLKPHQVIADIPCLGSHGTYRGIKSLTLSACCEPLRSSANQNNVCLLLTHAQQQKEGGVVADADDDENNMN